jgi:hypothetical protein
LALVSRKISKSGLVGILVIWAASFVLTILREPVAVPTLLVTVACAAALTVSKADLRQSSIMEIISSTLVILLLIESSTVFYWIGAALNPQGRVGILSEQLEANLTFSLFPIATLMIVLLLFSWLWIPMATRLPRFRREMVVRYESSTNRWSPRMLAAALDLFAIIVVLVFFYPYLAGQTWIVGVDSYLRYLNPLKSLAGLPPSKAIVTSYTHGPYVLLLYLIELASGASSFSIVKYAPLLLAFATASTIFLVVMRAGWSFQLAILSSICGLLWLPTTLGTYAGIQANWFALVLWMLFLSFYLGKTDWKAATFIIQAFISLAVFLIHPWSWGVFVVSLGITALISRRSMWKKHCLYGLSAAIIAALPVGIAAYEFLPGVRNDLASTMQLYLLTLFNPVSVLSFGGALVDLFYNWGSFLSPILLLICLVGAYSLSKRRGITANYLLAWGITWCIGSFMIAPVEYNPVNVGISETGLWRMLYLSPLTFLLALGFERVTGAAKSLGSSGVNSRLTLLLSGASLLAFGAGLFIFWNPLVRLLIVLGAAGSALLVKLRFPNVNIMSMLVASLLVLFLVNAAFRSLFPLLLDPHSVFGPLGAR